MKSCFVGIPSGISLSSVQGIVQTAVSNCGAVFYYQTAVHFK